MTLSRLAALDSASPLAGPALIAEIAGEAVAALALDGGASVADPFRRTKAPVELLELRAMQLREPAGGSAKRSIASRARALLRGTRPVPQR